MNRDERTSVKITATWNEAGCEPTPPERRGSDGLKNQAPPSGSCRASATVIR
jgi:hypothetical protein